MPSLSSRPPIPEPSCPPPITYRVDRERGVIFEKWQGMVRARDLEQFWTTFLEDPEVLELRRTLVDVREATVGFRGDELADLITRLVVPVVQGRSWQTAIVVSSLVQFGVSRQFQILADRYQHDAIFEDEWEALRWLETRPLA